MIQTQNQIVGFLLDGLYYAYIRNAKEERYSI